MLFFHLQLYVLRYVTKKEVTVIRVDCVNAIRDGVVWTVVQHSVLTTATQWEDTAMSQESVSAMVTGMAQTATSSCAIQTAAW